MLNGAIIKLFDWLDDKHAQGFDFLTDSRVGRVLNLPFVVAGWVATPVWIIWDWWDRRRAPRES